MRRLAALVLAVALVGCTNLETVRLQPETVEVGPGLRPVAGIQANALSFYLLTIGIPGISLDEVVNQMLVVAAKSMGADKVAQVTFEIDPRGGGWGLWTLFWFRQARASGIAVQVEAPPADERADEGPEPATAPAPR